MNKGNVIVRFGAVPAAHALRGSAAAGTYRPEGIRTGPAAHPRDRRPAKGDNA